MFRKSPYDLSLEFSSRTAPSSIQPTTTTSDTYLLHTFTKITFIHSDHHDHILQSLFVSMKNTIYIKHEIIKKKVICQNQSIKIMNEVIGELMSVKKNFQEKVKNISIRLIRNIILILAVRSPFAIDAHTIVTYLITFCFCFYAQLGKGYYCCLMLTKQNNQNIDDFKVTVKKMVQQAIHTTGGRNRKHCYEDPPLYSLLHSLNVSGVNRMEIKF